MKTFRTIKGRETQSIEDKINQMTTGKTFVVTNVSEKRDLDINTATTSDTLNILGTLIQELQKRGIL
jgi:hypothetical protein